MVFSSTVSERYCPDLSNGVGFINDIFFLTQTLFCPTVFKMMMIKTMMMTMGKTMITMTFSLSSAAPSSLIFFSGVTSGELFSSAGKAEGSGLPVKW